MQIELDTYQINSTPNGTVITAYADGPLLKSSWHEAQVKALISGDDLVLSHKGVKVQLKSFPRKQMIQGVPIYFAGLNAAGKITISCQAQLN